MRALHRFFTRVLNFATRHRGDERLREEIESHIATQTEENIRAGMTPEEARRQAGVKFGAVEAVRQDYQAETGLPFLEDLLLDIRYALRVLWKSPAFTLVALVTLMLGIGANVVVFGVLNAVLLHPLEVSDPQNLYQLRLKPWTSFRLLTTSYPAFEDFRQRNTTFSGIAGFNGFAQARLGWGNAARSVSGYAVTGNYFELLGVQPQVGRFFQATDEHGPKSAPYVVLSNDLWRSAFNADPGVVGTTVRLDKDPFTVVGVAPAQFHGTEQFVWPDYWIPIVNSYDPEYLQSRAFSSALTVLGRLKPRVTPEQATENLNAIAAQLAKEYPKTDSGLPLRLVRPGLYADDGDVIRGFLYSVTGLALLVLVAACANLASLFAARAADRSRELALRVALGASRWRLVRQLITEAMVVSMLGGAAGLVTASLLLGALNRWRSPYGHVAVSVDARVYLAALTFTLVSALLFGMIPARQVSQSSPLQAMKGGANAPAPVCNSGPLVRRTDCHLHAAGHSLARRCARHGAHATRSAGLRAAGRDAGRDGPEPGGTGRRRAAREEESDDRSGAEHPRRSDGGDAEQSALYRRAAGYSGFLARDDRVYAEQFCASAVPVYDIAGLPRGCRHPAPAGPGCLMA
jgi:ABC-type antimicrobial peptide transport system permease subunit